MKKPFSHVIILVLIFALVCSFASLFLVGCNDIFEDNALDEDSGTNWEVSEDSKIDDGSTPIKVAVVADLHTISPTQIENMYEGTWESHTYTYNMKLDFSISEAILKTSVDEIIASEPDVAVLLGDLTDDSALVAMQSVASECARLEAAGITVIVTGGLRDFNATTSAKIYKETFTEDIATATKQDYLNLFAKYGYGNAVMQDANSLSYLAEIPNTDYCALVIDTASNFTGDVHALDKSEAPTMSDEQLSWIEKALQYCEKTGKTPLAISYFPINFDPFPYIGKATKGVVYALDRGDEVLKLFAKYGVSTVLSSNTNVEEEYEHNIDGKTIKEISTACLCGYPCPTKYCKVYKTGCTCNSVFLQSVTSSYIPTYVNAEDKALMCTDLATYSKTYYATHLPHQTLKNVYNRDSAEPVVLRVLRLLNLYGYEGQSEDSIAAALESDAIITKWMKDVNAMQIYGEGDTVEGIYKEYGLSLPASKYTGCTVYELILDIAYSLQDGTFEYVPGDVTIQLLKAIMKTGMAKLADADLFAAFIRISPDLQYSDQHQMLERIMYEDVMDLKQGNFLMAMSSFFVPSIKKLGVLSNFILPIITDGTPESLLAIFSNMMPFVMNLSENFKYFTNDNGEFKMTYVDIDKGEIYLDAFTEDVIIDVIARTAVLE